MVGQTTDAGTAVPMDQVIREHDEIRDLLHEIRGFLDRPRPELENAGYHTWAAELSGHLVKLHDKLFRHFRHEEQTGILEELILKHPNASPRIEAMQQDHREIVADVRQLATASLKYGENKAPEDLHLRKRLQKILDRLDRHEATETNLIQRLVYRELGTGD